MGMWSTVLDRPDLMQGKTRRDVSWLAAKTVAIGISVRTMPNADGHSRLPLRKLSARFDPMWSNERGQVRPSSQNLCIRDRKRREGAGAMGGPLARALENAVMLTQPEIVLSLARSSSVFKGEAHTHDVTRGRLGPGASISHNH